jgi:hypothetical protein
MTRVFIIEDRDLKYPLCEPCIDTMVDPAMTRSAIVARADDAHCVECDYHPTHTASCPANISLQAVSRVSAILASHYPIEADR